MQTTAVGRAQNQLVLKNFAKKSVLRSWYEGRIQSTFPDSSIIESDESVTAALVKTVRAQQYSLFILLTTINKN